MDSPLDKKDTVESPTRMNEHYNSVSLNDKAKFEMLRMTGMNLTQLAELLLF